MFIEFNTNNETKIKIEDYQFFGQTDLSEYTVGSDVGFIGAGAFSGCTGLSEVIFEGRPDRIGEGAFFGCSALTVLSLPDSVNEIGDHAFSACSSLEKIVFAASPFNIGKGAFQGCKALKAIEIATDADGGTGGRYCSLEGVMFSKGRDGSLTLEVFPQGKGGSYRTPDGVRYIADGAFRGCAGLDEVTLGESVEWIGNRAFAGCPDIKIIIENKEIGVGQLPFEETANVSLAASKKNNPFARFDEPDFEEKLANIKYVFPVNKKFVVPKEKWSSQDSEGGAEITSYNGDEAAITVPSKIDEKTVTKIGDYAFSPEKGGIDKKRRDILQQIKSVFMARTIRQIGTGAFKNCSSLEYVLVPGSVEKIGDRAFSGCLELEAVTLPDGLCSIGNGVFFGCKKLDSIEIPTAVKEIGDLAFSGCEHVTFITIPDGVTKIGRKAFSGCKYLAYITFPDSLEYVGMEAFKDTMWYSGRPEGVIYAGKCAVGYKGSSSAVEFREDTVSISPAVFRNNEFVKRVVIPESVKSIGAEAFFNCSKLDDVVLPEGLKELGEHTFAACRMLKDISLPDGLEKINEFAFSGCTALRNIEIPDSVRVIERDAFRSCSNLMNIHMSEYVERIDDEAFIGCESLTEVILPDSLTSIGERVFASLPAIVIRAHAGSAAEQYARLNHIRFMPL